MIKLISFLPILIIGTSAYSQESTKGNWNEADRQELRDGFEENRAIFQQVMDDEMIDSLIECICPKIENKFDSFHSFKYDPESEIEAEMEICMDQIGYERPDGIIDPDPESSKGNWSENDHIEMDKLWTLARQSYKNMLDSTSLDIFMDCMAERTENFYKNAHEAMKDKSNKIAKWSHECLEGLDVLTPKEDYKLPGVNYPPPPANSKSTIGNWSENDKEWLREGMVVILDQYERFDDLELRNIVLNCMVGRAEYQFDNPSDALNNLTTLQETITFCLQHAD